MYSDWIKTSKSPTNSRGPGISTKLVTTAAFPRTHRIVRLVFFPNFKTTNTLFHLYDFVCVVFQTIASQLISNFLSLLSTVYFIFGSPFFCLVCLVVFSLFNWLFMCSCFIWASTIVYWTSPWFPKRRLDKNITDEVEEFGSWRHGTSIFFSGYWPNKSPVVQTWQWLASQTDFFIITCLSAGYQEQVPRTALSNVDAALHMIFNTDGLNPNNGSCSIIRSSFKVLLELCREELVDFHSVQSAGPSYFLCSSSYVFSWP